QTVEVEARGIDLGAKRAPLLLVPGEWPASAAAFAGKAVQIAGCPRQGQHALYEPVCECLCGRPRAAAIEGLRRRDRQLVQHMKVQVAAARLLAQDVVEHEAVEERQQQARPPRFQSRYQR